MPDVRLPDGSIARFPEGMSDADIEAAIPSYSSVERRAPIRE